MYGGNHGRRSPSHMDPAAAGRAATDLESFYYVCVCTVCTALLSECSIYMAHATHREVVEVNAGRTKRATLTLGTRFPELLQNIIGQPSISIWCCKLVYECNFREGRVELRLASGI